MAHLHIIMMADVEFSAKNKELSTKNAGCKEKG